MAAFACHIEQIGVVQRQKEKKRETGRMDNIQVTSETVGEEASVEKRD